MLKQYLKFVIPSICSMVIFNLYTLVDGIFVAHYEGDTALASINVASPYVTTIFSIGVLFAIGSSLGVIIAPVFGLDPLFVAALGYSGLFGAATNTFLAPIAIAWKFLDISIFRSSLLYVLYLISQIKTNQFMLCKDKSENDLSFFVAALKTHTNLREQVDFI